MIRIRPSFYLVLDWDGIVAAAVITYVLMNLNVFEGRLISQRSQTSSCVEDVSSPGRGREAELDLVVDDLRVTLDFGLNLSREVVLDIGEDLSIMGLKDVDTALQVRIIQKIFEK